MPSIVPLSKWFEPLFCQYSHATKLMRDTVSNRYIWYLQLMQLMDTVSHYPMPTSILCTTGVSSPCCWFRLYSVILLILLAIVVVAVCWRRRWGCSWRWWCLWWSLKFITSFSVIVFVPVVIIVVVVRLQLVLLLVVAPGLVWVPRSATINFRLSIFFPDTCWPCSACHMNGRLTFWENDQYLAKIRVRNLAPPPTHRDPLPIPISQGLNSPHLDWYFFCSNCFLFSNKFYRSNSCIK